MTATPKKSSQKPLPLAELHSGDRLTRKEFHRIYEEMPEDFKAELIGGIVFVASPLKYKHGKYDQKLGLVFGLYEESTTGVSAAHNVTVFLSDEDEVQPDLVLRIESKFGGQSRLNADDYLEGAPELVAEIAISSRSLDLHAKRDLYKHSGVIEYVVVCANPPELHWFDLRNDIMLRADSDGIIRSAVFPGMWLHAESFLKLEIARVMEILNQGIQSSEHNEFVSKMLAFQTKKKKFRRAP